MRSQIRFLAFVAALAGLGIAMPSCPGKEAIQQQVDALRQSDAEATKKIQALETQLKVMHGDVTKMKEIIGQMSNTILEQRSALNQLDAFVKAFQTKPAAKPSAKAPSKSPPKKKRR